MRNHNLVLNCDLSHAMQRTSSSRQFQLFAAATELDIRCHGNALDADSE